MVPKWPRWLIHLTRRPALLRSLSRPKVRVSRADYLSHSTSVIGDAISPSWRSPSFCSFRPHAGSVSSGQIFVTCCHADGCTEMLTEVAQIPAGNTRPRAQEPRRRDFACVATPVGATSRHAPDRVMALASWVRAPALASPWRTLRPSSRRCAPRVSPTVSWTFARCAAKTRPGLALPTFHRAFTPRGRRLLEI
jgi:hypothetical protein